MLYRPEQVAGFVGLAAPVPRQRQTLTVAGMRFHIERNASFN